MSVAEAPRTEDVLLEVATRVFRERGYGVATLDEIAAELGISRPAILHHFGSKKGLLDAIVRPYMTQVDALLGEWAAEAPLTKQGQRRFLTAFVELLAEHRDVAALVGRDITAHPHFAPDLRIEDRSLGYTALIIDKQGGDLAGLRGVAALGVLARATIAPKELVDLDDPEVREALVDAALAALRSGKRR